MKKVVLDTNALFFPFQFKVNIENEITALVGSCDIVVPDIVLEELRNLQKKGNKNAGAALRYAERFETYQRDSPTEVGGDPGRAGRIGKNEEKAQGAGSYPESAQGDTAILKAADALKAILVTSDKVLIGRAKEKGLQVIFLRGKQRLELK